MKRKPAPPAPNLSNDVVAILLAGWGAEPPAGEPRTRGFGGGFLELGVTGGPGPAGLWRQHAAFLRDMAQRWGWTPSIVGPDGRRRFYGEHKAVGYGDADGAT